MSNNSVMRSIEVNNEILTYNFTKKNVKNINLRIKGDGSIHISAPHRISVEYVDKFVRRQEKFIFSRLERFKKLREELGGALEESYRIFKRNQLILQGNRYTVEIRSSNKNYIEQDKKSGLIIVNSIYPQNEQKTQEIVDKWIRKEVTTVVTELCFYFYPQFEKYGIPFPEIKVRKMKKRWGSCNYTRKSLIFALMLLQEPRAFIEYVVVHELAHLVEPNHSEAFYEVLSDVMPDWKERL